MQGKVQEMLSQFMSGYRRLWRKRHNLLLIRSGSMQLAVEYWQKGQLLWHETVVLESLGIEEKYFAEVEEKLRSLLLAKEVEDNIETLFVPADFMLQTEQLELPLLNALELRQAMSWEAANAFPWEEGSYAYAYLVQKQAAAESCQIFLWGLPLASLEAMESMTEKLLLKTQFVVSLAPEQLGTEWYQGVKLAVFKRHEQAFLPQPKVQRLLARAAGCALLISVACYAGAWLGCYLAQEEARTLEEELAQYRPWQERQQASLALEEKIQRLEKLVAAKKQNLAQPMSGDLERLSRLIASGCWLTQLTQERGSIKLEGKALNMQSLQSFMDKLQQADTYKSVELKQSNLQAGKVEYRLELERKEGEHEK